MFANSLNIVEECGLTHLHVFPFSPREGTPAARMPQVRREIVKERAARLRAAGAAAYRRHLDALAGTRQSILVERDGIGRTEGFALAAIDAGTPGEIVAAMISGHDGARLIAAPARAGRLGPTARDGARLHQEGLFLWPQGGRGAARRGRAAGAAEFGALDALKERRPAAPERRSRSRRRPSRRARRKRGLSRRRRSPVQSGPSRRSSPVGRRPRVEPTPQEAPAEQPATDRAEASRPCRHRVEVPSQPDRAHPEPQRRRMPEHVPG